MNEMNGIIKTKMEKKRLKKGMQVYFRVGNALVRPWLCRRRVYYQTAEMITYYKPSNFSFSLNERMQVIMVEELSVGWAFT